MNNLKKGFNLFLAALLVMVSVSVASPVKAVETGVETTLPEIDFAVQAHYPLYVGETQSVYVKSNYEGQVQYRAFLKEADGTWSEITEGYTDAVDANVAYEIVSEKEYKAGDNYFVVWVKRAEVADEDLANNTAVIKESEIPALAGKKKCYDNYSFIKMTTTEGEDVVNLDEVEVVTEGLNVSVEGNEELFYAIQARDLNAAENPWLEKAAYTKATATRELAEGNYLVALWAANEAEANYPAAYRLVEVETAEAVAETAEVFTTTLVPGATVGSKVEVAMTEEGKAELADAAKFQVYFEDGVAHSAVATLGEATIVYPAVEEGTEVTVKLLAEDGSEVLAAKVKIGEAYTMELDAEEPAEEPVDDVEYNVTATLVPGATVGSKVKVETAEEGAAKYQVLIDGTAHSAIATLGEATIVYPAVEAGDTVSVKLLAEDGTTVVTTVENVVISE